jgi:hypothetical protein
MIWRHPDIDAPGRDTWHRAFAWLPVTLWDGTRVWLVNVEWRYSFTSLVGSYFEPEKPLNHRVWKLGEPARLRPIVIAIGMAP